MESNKQAHFLDRIYGEYQAFKAGVLGLPNAEIYGRSYEIDCMANLYEILAEKAGGFSDDTIDFLLAQKHLLRGLYIPCIQGKPGKEPGRRWRTEWQITECCMN